jgi:U3 small nucleolar RNA-associated protein 13
VLRIRFLCSGLQLASSGADGLVKIWTIRTSTCETTLDRHDDKVWALDVDSSGTVLVSGGADSQLFIWEDTTREVEDAKRQEYEEAILLDQSLANHLRHKEYVAALEIALGRDKPEHTLKILTAIIESGIQDGCHGLKSLQEHAKRWSTDQVLRILRYCRDWNTRALNSHVALMTIKAVVSTVPVHSLTSMDGVAEILAGITPYAERHFDRLDRLHAGSFLLDFILCSMGSIDGDEDGNNNITSWESSSKFVLPAQQIDGRIQIGGRAIVGRYLPSSSSAADESDVITLGDSGSEDE